MQKNYKLEVLMNEVEVMMDFEIVTIAFYPDGSIQGLNKDNKVVVGGNYYHSTYVIWAFLEMIKYDPVEYPVYFINTGGVLHDPFFAIDIFNLKFTIGKHKPTVNIEEIGKIQNEIEEVVPRLKNNFQLTCDGKNWIFRCSTPEIQKVISASFELFSKVAVC